MGAGLAYIAAAVLALAPPAGFSRSAPLTERAARVSGRDAAVYCARDFAAWSSFMQQSGLGRIAAEIDGLTRIERRETFLHPRVCRRLHGWLAGRPIALPTLADAVFTFVHEAAHVAGVVNECAADRWAMRRLERVARTEFGIRNRARLRELVLLARESAGYVAAC